MCSAALENHLTCLGHLGPCHSMPRFLPTARAWAMPECTHEQGYAAGKGGVNTWDRFPPKELMGVGHCHLQRHVRK